MVVVNSVVEVVELPQSIVSFDCYFDCYFGGGGSFCYYDYSGMV